MKFIHASDLHIDSPMRGLSEYEGAPTQRLRGATRLALNALVDLAIDQSVDFVILAGDIYDGDWTDFRTGLFFREQMLRLTQQGIRVFVCKGNHDAASVITRQLPAVDGVHVFDSRKAETVELTALNVALHGQSFPQRAVPEDLVLSYPAPVPGKFNIGVLHTSLSGRPGHDPYAPTSVAVLTSKGYDYFALGHVHAREIVHDCDPRIVFPGNLQGRDARETGPKGCELVTVSDGTITSTEFVALDVVRWHQIHLNATGLDNVDALSSRFIDHMREQTALARDRLHAVRVIVHGESSLHRLEAQQPGVLAAAIQAAAQDCDDFEVWIEEVRLQLRSPLDRTAGAMRTDAIGDVMRLVDSLCADEALLKSWALEQLKDLPSLPRDLAAAAPDRLTVDELRMAIIDAEASVLAQLSNAVNSGQ